MIWSNGPTDETKERERNQRSNKEHAKQQVVKNVIDKHYPSSTTTTTTTHIPDALKAPRQSPTPNDNFATAPTCPPALLGQWRWWLQREGEEREKRERKKREKEEEKEEERKKREKEEEKEEEARRRERRRKRKEARETKEGD